MSGLLTGTNSNTSSSTNLSNSGINTNSTSVNQPISPIYNVSVTNAIPESSTGSNLGGILTNGIINSNIPATSNINIYLIIGLILLLVIGIIFYVK